MNIREYQEYLNKVPVYDVSKGGFNEMLLHALHLSSVAGSLNNNMYRVIVGQAITPNSHITILSAILDCLLNLCNNGQINIDDLVNINLEKKKIRNANTT